MNSIIKTVVVTNVPAPYRVPGWELVSRMSDIKLNVIFCSKSNIDSTLNSNSLGFSAHYLRGKYREYGIRFLHSDIGIWTLMNELQPEVVVTMGFIPTYLFAFAWAIVHKVPHIAMTDGTIQSEKSLSSIHRFLRKVVFRRSAAFVGASKGSIDLFQSYGVEPSKIHQSALCVHNQKFNLPESEKIIDLLFSGRLIDLKNPLFAIQVAASTAKILGRKTSLDILGQGEIENEVRAFAESLKDQVTVRFLGYLAQRELPEIFSKARIFLFPTKFDCWGLVANEACAAGLPVLISPHAGAAGELVKSGVNGYVLELDAQYLEQMRPHTLSRTISFMPNFPNKSKELSQCLQFRECRLRTCCSYPTGCKEVMTLILNFFTHVSTAI